MDSYVVRVYPREKRKGLQPAEVRGVVEDAVTGLRWGFESSDQLWSIITSNTVLDNSLSKIEKKSEVNSEA